MKIAIIGSSLTGCFASDILSEKGNEIVIFEKGNKSENIDSNDVIKNAVVNGKKTKVLNEGIGGTSQLWTGGLLRNFNEEKICLSEKALKEISRLFDIDSSDLINDIRDKSDLTFQKTLVLYKPKRGMQYLKKLIIKNKKISIKINTLVTQIEASKNHVMVKYKEKNSCDYQIEKFDKCIIANGLIGFHKLLPEIKFNSTYKKDFKIKSKYKFMTHPKLDAGIFYSNTWGPWNKEFGNKKILSNCYVYERIILPIELENNEKRFLGLRIESRRMTRLIKLSIIFTKILNPSIAQLFVKLIDNFYRKICLFFNLQELFNIRVFIADEFKGESYLKYNGKKFNIFCSINSEYLEVIEKNLKLQLDKLNIKKYALKNFKDWEITLLHSHLCGSILMENELIEIFKENNIVTLSTINLPVGYYNPMLESLIQTYDKVESL